MNNGAVDGDGSGAPGVGTVVKRRLWKPSVRITFLWIRLASTGPVFFMLKDIKHHKDQPNPPIK